MSIDGDVSYGFKEIYFKPFPGSYYKFHLVIKTLHSGATLGVCSILYLHWEMFIVRVKVV